MHPVSDLASLLSLEQVKPDAYLGAGPVLGWGRIYGGQVVAQALAAAGLTVADHLRPQSLHAYFVPAGDEHLPVLYEVERAHDSGSFATRQVVAYQAQGAVLNLIASFHRPEPSIDIAAVTAPTGRARARVVAGEPRPISTSSGATCCGASDPSPTSWAGCACLSAMGIAAAGVGLSRQALADRVNGKNILAGLAAKDAVEAALLARQGVAGAPNFLTGIYGLNALYGGGSPPATLGIKTGAAFRSQRSKYQTLSFVSFDARSRPRFRVGYGSGASQDERHGSSPRCAAGSL